MSGEGGVMSYLRPADTPRPPTGDEQWLAQIFEAKSARTGGVVRRKICDVERKVGRHALELEVHRRGFHLVEAGTQFVIICTPGDIRVIC
jgi:hypothetical protein